MATSKTTSRFCPKCNVVLKTSKNSWVYCPNKYTAKNCAFKGFSARQTAVTNSLPISPLKKPSQEQADIFARADASLSDACFMLIMALAGTGKTTALVQLVRIFAQELGLSVLCLAFARRDKLALEERCNTKGKVLTSNGAGYSILSTWMRQNGRKGEWMNDNVAWQVLESQWTQDGHMVSKDGKTEWKLPAAVFYTILSLCDKVRTVLPLSVTGKQAPTDQDFMDVAERFDLDMPQEHLATIIHYAHTLFTALASMKTALTYGVDFNGQVFLPVYHNMRPATLYDRVLIDETQDQNYYNRQTAFLFVNATGKAVAVGDCFQAIYGWRGADKDSMGEMAALMAQRGGMVPEQFPLTLNRRSVPAVIQAAQKIVPAIRGLTVAEWLQVQQDEAQRNGVTCPYTLEMAQADNRHIKEAELFDELCEKKTGYVLCRANAPLISLCLKLLAKRIPAALSRSDITGQLLKLIDTLTEHNDDCPIANVLGALEAWASDKLAKIAKQKNATAKAQIVADKVACIHALADETSVQTANDLKRKIDEIFANDTKIDPKTMVVLSTIHGAKGGEADYVFLLSPESLKVSIFDQVWSDATDRDNTLYVAITRARLPITFVGIMPTLARFSPLPGEEQEGEEFNPETAEVA